MTLKTRRDQPFLQTMILVAGIEDYKISSDLRNFAIVRENFPSQPTALASLLAFRRARF